MGVCNCPMFCCMLLYVHSSIVIILMGKRELIALLNLSSWCLVMVERLFLAVPWGCLRFVIVVFPDHTHLLFFYMISSSCVYTVFCLLFLSHPFFKIHTYILFVLALLRLIFLMVFFYLNDFCLAFYSISCPSSLLTVHH